VSTWHKVKEILRIAYTLPFVLSSIAGVTFAFTVGHFSLISFLIPLDVFFLALFVNFSNDYFDYKSGVDKVRFGDRDETTQEKLMELFNQKIFWSGNCFDKGLITEKQGKILMWSSPRRPFCLPPIVLYEGWIAVISDWSLWPWRSSTRPPAQLEQRLGELDVAYRSP